MARVWWLLLIVALVFAALSFLAFRQQPRGPNRIDMEDGHAEQQVQATLMPMPHQGQRLNSATPQVPLPLCTDPYRYIYIRIRLHGEPCNWPTFIPYPRAHAPPCLPRLDVFGTANGHSLTGSCLVFVTHAVVKARPLLTPSCLWCGPIRGPPP